MDTSDAFLLLCGGPGTRWDNFLGTTKHLISIDGERLLDRNIRLFNPTVVGPYENAVPPSKCREKSKRPASKFLDSMSLWNYEGFTVFLFGDVYFTEAATETILSTYSLKPWTFYGRSSPNQLTGHNTGEIFAVSIHTDELAKFVACVGLATNTKNRKVFKEGCANGLGWLTYYLMNNQPTQPKWKNFGNLIEISDFTDDFDTPEQYELWLDAYQKAKGIMIP